MAELSNSNSDMPLFPGQNMFSLSRQSIRALAASTLLIASVAWAGTHRRTGVHSTSKSPSAVMDILLSYSETCGQGCKYSRPDLVEVKKLAHGASENSWYTWTRIDGTLKDVRYFTHVTLIRGDDGSLTLDGRQLDESDRKLIDDLEKRTGLKHAPAFDTGLARTTAAPVGSGSKVTQKVTLTSSGMLAMWPGKIEEGMRVTMESTFKNIGP